MFSMVFFSFSEHVGFYITGVFGEIFLKSLLTFSGQINPQLITVICKVCWPLCIIKGMSLFPYFLTHLMFYVHQNILIYIHVYEQWRERYYSDIDNCYNIKAPNHNPHLPQNVRSKGISDCFTCSYNFIPPLGLPCPPSILMLLSWLVSCFILLTVLSWRQAVFWKETEQEWIWEEERCWELGETDVAKAVVRIYFMIKEYVS